MRLLSGVGRCPKAKADNKIVIVAFSANKLIDTEGRKGEKTIRDVKGTSRTVPRQDFSEKLCSAFGFQGTNSGCEFVRWKAESEKEFL